MIRISHRGNIDGIEPDTENSPEQIKKALDLGYNVEVDVWKTGDEIYLGHDAPEYKVDILKLEFPANLKFCSAYNDRDFHAGESTYNLDQVKAFCR